MKKFKLLFFFICLSTYSLFAQNNFAFQGMLRNSNGNAAENASFLLRVNIFNENLNGSLVYQEVHELVSDSNGWFYALVGQGETVFGDFNTIDFTTLSKYFQAECSSDNGASYAPFYSSPLFNHLLKGPQGLPGIQGIQGLEGPDGLDGAGFNIVGTVNQQSDLPLPYNGAIGDIMIIDTDGSGALWVGNQWIGIGLLRGSIGPAGIPGVIGDIGGEGDTGDPASTYVIAIGQISHGDEPEANITGSPGHGTLNITYPDGFEGPVGEPGLEGLPGDVGTQGSQGEMGIAGLMGQVGEVGPLGPMGIPGIQGPFGIAGDYTAGPGISIVSDVLSNTGDTNPNDDITSNTVLGGDLSGSISNVVVSGVQNTPVSNFTPQQSEHSKMLGITNVNPITFGLQAQYWTPINNGLRYLNLETTFANSDEFRWKIGNNEIFMQGRDDVDLGRRYNISFKTANESVLSIFRTNSIYAFEPLISNVDLGTASLRWKTIYSVNPFNSSSDFNLKKNITPIHDEIGNLMSIHPVSFQWKDGDTAVHLGLIAQEIEKLYPSITLRDDQGKLSMNYEELIPILVSVIQQQNEQLNQLESAYHLLTQTKN